MVSTEKAWAVSVHLLNPCSAALCLTMVSSIVSSGAASERE
jgi:hypothetical protein